VSVVAQLPLKGAHQRLAPSPSKRTLSADGCTAPKVGGQLLRMGRSVGAGENAVCVNCHTSKTPMWRRALNSDLLCNACGLYQKTHGMYGNLYCPCCVVLVSPAIAVVCMKSKLQKSAISSTQTSCLFVMKILCLPRSCYAGVQRPLFGLNYKDVRKPRRTSVKRPSTSSVSSTKSSVTMDDV
jgi:hypothetical protein